jgi:hypothetical protein
MKNNLFLIILIIIFILFFILFLGTNFYEGYVNMPSIQTSSTTSSIPSSTTSSIPSSTTSSIPSSTTSSTPSSKPSSKPSSTPSQINITSKVFYGSNGTQATLITDDNNNIDSILVISPKTGTSVFIPNNNNNNNNSNSNNNNQTSNQSNTYTLTSNTYIDQNGNKAKILKNNNGDTIIKINYEGNIVIFKNNLPNSGYTNNDYNNSNYQNYSNSINDSSSSSNNIDKYTSYNNDNNNNNVDDNNITNISQNDNSKPLITNYDSSSYYNSKQGFNNGIPASEIPKGSEDLYILKSQIVPPVCPVCPSPIVKNCDKSRKCPPCPAPQRCPSESDFICKKEPNYQNINSNVQKMLPLPVLNSFSSFGM